MWFTSDNAGPAHPKVMEALIRANEGYAGSYGGDPLTEAAVERIRDVFEAPEAAVYLVATGTAANVLGLATITRPWEAIYCHQDAHIEVDECNGPEHFTGGAKLTLLPGAHGKIDPAALADTLEAVPEKFVHHPQKGPLALTQATEFGAVYSLDELRALTGHAKQHGLPVHLDGARFANALVRLGCSPAEMSWKAGIDVVSFGGTKNGLLAAEAVIFFNPDHAWEFELRRKRAAHLFSKHRFLSAQMLAALQDDLWLDMARQANDMAGRLAAGLEAQPGAALAHPVDANMLFVSLPRRAHRRAMERGAKYHLWSSTASLEGAPDEPLMARLVCNWSTTPEDVDAVLSALSD